PTGRGSSQLRLGARCPLTPPERGGRPVVVADRLSTSFARCREHRRAALVTFVTGGDPSPAATPAILDALVEGGADIIELGMPFTDPMADGPAIQKATCVRLAPARPRA